MPTIMKELHIFNLLKKKKNCYFKMWDYIHTEGMRQRGTLTPLNKLAQLESSAWIVPLQCLYLYIGIFTFNWMPSFIYTDVHTYPNKHTYIYTFKSI